MRKNMLLLAVFGIVGSLWGASPFDGTWKIDVNSAQFPEKPQTNILQNGVFQCTTCDPKINVKADGMDQPTPGTKDSDTLAVKIVDDKTVQTTTKKGGKVVSISKTTVSSDGKTAIAEFTDYPVASKQPVNGKVTLIRVADGPSGSHAASGSWRIQKLSASENALLFTFKGTPDGLMMTDPLGESIDAKFDGKEYPVKGAPAGLTVSMAKVSEHSIISTTKRDGKMMSVDHLTVSADGKTLAIRSENKIQGTVTTFTATKQ